MSDFTSNRAGKVVKTERDYWVFLPNPLPPQIEYSAAIVSRLAEAQRFLSELAGVGRMLPNPYLLVGPATRKEAVLSSRIEGTRADIGDLLFFEAEPADQPSVPDVREVHNYVIALDFGLKRIAQLPVSGRLLREIHERLMAGVRGGHGTPGEFRITQNWIGPPGCTLNEATFVPPPVDEMREAIATLEQYIHEPSSEPELIRLALIHAQFEMIHPFVDGNGRVGRLLLTLLLCYWGLLPEPLLYLSAFFERHRGDYYASLLRISQEGEWEAWIEFFLTAVREQSKDALVSAKALLDIQERYRELLRGRRVSKATSSVLDQLFANPFITAPMIRDRWSVNFRTAQSAIDDLVGVGIVSEVTGQRRNRLWLAHEIMNIFAGRLPGQE